MRGNGGPEERKIVSVSFCYLTSFFHDIWRDREDIPLAGFIPAGINRGLRQRMVGRSPNRPNADGEITGEKLTRR
jgi:hypothetical protein